MTSTKNVKRTILAITAVAALALVASIPTVTEAAMSPEDVQSLYNKKCAMCHGKDGVAKKMATGSGNFNDAEWKTSVSKEAIVKISTEGRNKMPKFEGKLKPEEIDALADFVLKME